MKGTMNEVRPDVWRLRVVRDYRPDGQPRQASRTVRGNKRHAQTELARFVTEVLDGSAPMSGDMTVEQFFARWLVHAQTTVSRDTLRNYELRCKRFGAEFGKERLDRLRASHLDLTYSKWLERGMAPSTVAAYHSVISTALSQAVKWGLLGRNVARLATRPRVPRRPSTMPTIEQIRNLIRATDHDYPVLSAAIFLAALTGARRGELLGLRWSDVDETKMTLTIGRSAKRGPRHRVEVGDTKTHSIRRVAIDEATLAALILHRQRAQGWARQAGLTLDGEGYILTDDPSGREPMNPDAITTAFRRAADSAGLENIRFHDLRHVVATSLLSAGHDLVTVAGRLGHSSATTLRHYAQFMEPPDRQAAGVMGHLLASTK